MQNPVIDHSQHTGMKSKRCCHKPFDSWMFFCSGSRKTRNVFGPVATRGKKIRKDDNLCRAASDAAIKGLRNGRVGKLHMSRLNNGELRLRGKASGCFMQHLIAFTTPRTMINNNDANNREHEDLERF